MDLFDLSFPPIELSKHHERQRLLLDGATQYPGHLQRPVVTITCLLVIGQMHAHINTINAIPLTAFSLQPWLTCMMWTQDHARVLQIVKTLRYTQHTAHTHGVLKEAMPKIYDRSSLKKGEATRRPPFFGCAT